MTLRALLDELQYLVKQNPRNADRTVIDVQSGYELSSVNVESDDEGDWVLLEFARD